jgi:RecA-family ATPase
MSNHPTQQAMKMFNQGSSGGGKSGQNQMIGIAMGEAAKLFDQQSSQGNTSSGLNKQDVVGQAAKMALQMYLKGGAGGAGGASSGGSSGGVGGLLNMASKFMK